MKISFYKIFPSLIMTLLVVFSLATSVQAIYPDYTGHETDDSGSDSQQSDSEKKTMLDRMQTAAGLGGYDSGTPNLPATIAGIVQILLGFIGIVFLALTVYAGYLWMTASGNEDKVTRAKDMLRNSIIGLAIVLAAYSITYFLFIWFEKAGGGVGPGGGGQKNS
ncbi:MAG: pilin [bacterium]